MSAVRFLPEWHCDTYRTCLHVLGHLASFAFLSFYHGIFLLYRHSYYVGVQLAVFACALVLLHICFLTLMYHVHDYIINIQCVALTGRNRTGPPCSVGRPPGRRSSTRPAAGLPARRTGSVTDYTDDDDRCQRAKQYWPIRRASYNIILLLAFVFVFW